MNLSKAVVFLACVSLSVACSKSGGSAGPNILTVSTEVGIRSLLGVPDDAKNVIILSQSSHLDPDWLKTFDEYYRLWVEPAFALAVKTLRSDPDYYYSICEVAFLKRFWDDHPELRSAMKSLARAGRLRIVGGGISSPDTILPDGEAILRDYLLGGRWTETYLGVRPRTAWLPDNFGHNTSLPDVLNQAGYKYVSFARMDGMTTFDPGTNFDSTPPTVLPGSTAEYLMGIGTADFVWKSASGAELLCHWMMYTYGQGDDIDMSIMTSIPGMHIEPTNPEPEFTNLKIQKYINQLKPFTKTPYMFVPVGTDFQMPKPGLTSYMKAWNEMKYPETGWYAVAATFDDYARLLEFHKHALPVLTPDLNPLWTGFYGSKPILKTLHYRASAALKSGEMVAAFAPAGSVDFPADELWKAWYNVAFSNHHDFITGTAVNYVYEGEQVPMLEYSVSAGDRYCGAAMDAFAANVSTDLVEDTPVFVLNPSSFTRSDTAVVDLTISRPGIKSVAMKRADKKDVRSQVISADRNADGTLKTARVLFVAEELPALGYEIYSAVPSTADESSLIVPSSPMLTYVSSTTTVVSDIASAERVLMNNDQLMVELSRSKGWAVTGIYDLATGANFLSGTGNDMLIYHDEGGPWRIGSESTCDGNDFSVKERLSNLPSSLEVAAYGPAHATLRVRTDFGGRTFTRDITLYSKLRRVDFTATGAAGEDETVTISFETGFKNARPRMGEPYGAVERPYQRIYTPTFWPASEWHSLVASNRSGATIARHGSTGVNFSSSGKIEFFVLRNARKECDQLGSGSSDPFERTARYSFIPHMISGWTEVEAYKAGRMLNAPIVARQVTRHYGQSSNSASFARVDAVGTFIEAVKRSEAGSGLVLRLRRVGAEEEVTVTTSLSGYNNVWVGDSYEAPVTKVAGTPASFTLNMDTVLKTVIFLK